MKIENICSNIITINEFEHRLKEQKFIQHWFPEYHYDDKLNPRQIQSLSGKFVIKQSLSNELNINPGNIIFKYNSNGKPFLELPDNSNYLISISHTQKYAAALMLKNNSNNVISCGYDIESINRFKPLVNNEVDWGENFINIVFTKEEQALFDGNIMHYALAFSAKEAIYKTLNINAKSKDISWHNIVIQDIDNSNCTIAVILNNLAADTFHQLRAKEIILNWKTLHNLNLTSVESIIF